MIRPPYRSSLKKQQKGLYAVEFAIVGSLFFLLLFAVIEVGRLFFVWNILTEATRRGARLAAVCYFDETNVVAYEDMINTALFNNQTMAPNLTAANLQIQYLSDTGVPAVDFSGIDFVRANIINYQHQMLIPGLALNLNSPTFSTTLPRESLGVTRETQTLCTPI